MTRPVVALQVSGVAPSGVHLLVRSMASRCEFRAQALAPAAVLVVGPTAGSTAGLATVPLALWCATAAEAQTPLAQRAAALLHDGALDHLSNAIRISPQLAGLSETAMGTAVRARLRQARGLTASPILVGGPAGWRWQGRPVPAELVATALGCAAVVVVTDPAELLQALSWGAPVVTSAAAAAAVGVSAGAQVLVAADDAARAALALTLAADDREAARLGRAGRQFIEQRHDLNRSLTRLALLLRLDAHNHPPNRSSTLLDSLSTPRDAAIRSRVALALAPLGQSFLEVPVLPDALSSDRTQALEPAAAEAPPTPPAAPAAAPSAKATARRVVKGALRRVVGAGAAQLLAELRANRAELARLQVEVAALRQAATSVASPEALVAQLELLKAQVDGLTTSAVPPQAGR